MSEWKAEQEPCDDAREVAIKVAEMMTGYFLEEYSDGDGKGIPPVRAIAEIVDAYAFRVADNRQVEVLRRALQNTTDQLYAMNTSPVHASSWVEPRSNTTTKRIKYNRLILAATELKT